MSFDWSGYYALARQLAGREVEAISEEAKLRSAISRAYYAAFNKARIYLLDNGHIESFPIHRDVHQDVSLWFLARPDKLSKDIGENLDYLRRLRNQADYQDELKNLTAIAADALFRAGSVIDKLMKLKRQSL
jgi:uncharacterized protein (UPF0332 family)